MKGEFKVRVTVKRRLPSGREATTVFDSRPRDYSMDQMKQLWEAEQTLNTLVPGCRFHIDVVEP